MNFYRLQALALLGGAGAVAVVFAIILFTARRVPTGGLDWEHSFIALVGAGVPAVLMIWAHVALARQSLTAARRESRGGAR